MQGFQGRNNVRHKCRWSADVVVAVRWQSQPRERVGVDAPSEIEVTSRCVTFIGLTVEHVTVKCRKGRSGGVDFLSENMMRSVTCRVHPPDFAGTSFVVCGQGMQHCEERGHADAGAKQHDRTFSRLQYKGPARRADVHEVANANASMQELATWAALQPDANSISVSVAGPGKRICPNDGRQFAFCV